MCGRYGLGKPEFSETRFGAVALPDLQPELLEPRYNIAPSQEILTVASSKRLGGERGLKAMQWGLTASWAVDDRRRPRPINLQSESLLERPAYRRLLAQRRCIVPADGFYEWRRAGSAKQPYNIGLRDGGLFGFAGLWEACKVADGWLVTAAILTTRPNALVAGLHDRQPVILRPEDEALWLDPACTDPDELMPLLEPLPAEAMAIQPVVPLVNNVANEGPELRCPADPAPGQMPLL